MTDCRTRYPLLLIHGLNCRDDWIFPYWGRVADILREHGATVYLSGQDAWGGVPGNARALLRLPDPDRQLEAARQLTADRLTVAQTEALVDSILLAAAPPPRRQPTFIIKDVRLFLNTITRSLDIMRSAGVDAQCKRQDSEEEILLTIHIPRRTG